jgi:hypothetical protein
MWEEGTSNGFAAEGGVTADQLATSGSSFQMGF